MSKKQPRRQLRLRATPQRLIEATLEQRHGFQIIESERSIDAESGSVLALGLDAVLTSGQSTTEKLRAVGLKTVQIHMKSFEYP